MKVLCGHWGGLQHLHILDWLVGNDKLLANPTHRPTVATEADVNVVTARIEAQVPSVVRVRRAEQRTPNVAAVAYIAR